MHSAKSEFLLHHSPLGFYSLGLLCYPIGHSLSSFLFSQFWKMGEPYYITYRRFAIKPEKLNMWLKRCKPHTIQGFNVSIPYKISVMSHLKGVSSQAQLIGAVNTVIVQKDGLYGENTDVHGFIEGMRPAYREKLPGAHALILGAGGASRAVVYALLEHGVRHITFVVRDIQRAEATRQIALQINAVLQDNKAIINLVTTLDDVDLKTVDWVINTTPVGMVPSMYDTPMSKAYLQQLPAHAIVYDLVYHPFETILLAEARDVGLTGQDGLGMLIHQAARSLNLWTGKVVSESELQGLRLKTLKELLDPSPAGSEKWPATIQEMERYLSLPFRSPGESRPHQP